MDDDVTDVEHLRRITGPVILLGNGRYFNFDDPEGSHFTIQDIARSLSNLCRFTGHTKHYFSVAQHCVIMSRMVPAEHALAALLHDATEAFINDLSRPLKRRCLDYRRLEERLEPVILARFGVTLPFHPCVLDADIRMQMTEQHQLMDNHDDWEYPLGTKPYDIHLGSWPPHEARERFLSRYRVITTRV